MAIRPYTRINGTRSTSGDGTAIIAAPASGKEAVIYMLMEQATEDTAVTILLKGGSTVLHRLRCAGDAQGYTGEFSELTAIRCGSGNAVYINLSGAAAMHYNIAYRIEDVRTPA